jgi:hypothetical protein
MIKFLGTTDDVTTCDCCGRTGLKSTVALEREDGAQVFYGVTCAALALKSTAKDVRKGARDADRAREDAERAKRDAIARADDLLWQAFLDGAAGRGADVSDGMGANRFLQIKKLGGFAVARELFTRKAAA